MGTPVLSPMPGTLIRYLVKVGDDVHVGDGICILEAMKMENMLPAPEEGQSGRLKCSRERKCN